jgi:hypothetical protein
MQVENLKENLLILEKLLIFKTLGSKMKGCHTYKHLLSFRKFEGWG